MSLRWTGTWEHEQTRSGQPLAAKLSWLGNQQGEVQTLQPPAALHWHRIPKRARPLSCSSLMTSTVTFPPRTTAHYHQRMKDPKGQQPRRDDETRRGQTQYTTTHAKANNPRVTARRSGDTFLIPRRLDMLYPNYQSYVKVKIPKEYTATLQDLEEVPDSAVP